ncbi:TPA: hypothetical protein DEF17_09745 [bacterium]|nr:MAG: hypothetical protein AUJ18_03975 [Candidatus Hydrogenedentes bacterium CG1_02_42_14]PIU47766.1 MAG: hypothetical protein COS94_05670 [Candidatus Hydrogenedentes bacterium CG07_land_8_20_14_0_80_42_17]HBW48189.1 hypothetical protein [bacterium]
MFSVQNTIAILLIATMPLAAHAEDSRVIVGKIEFTGNKAFSDAKLRSLMTQAKRRFFILPRVYDDLELENDLRRIVSHYQKHGYVFASATSETVDISSNRANVNVSVKEETKVILRSVSIEGSAGGLQFTEFSKLLRLRSGLPFNPIEASEARTRILRKFSDYGFAFAEASPIMDFHGNAVDVTFRLNAGPLVFFRKANITGNNAVKSSAIEKEISINRGAVMLQQDIALTRSRLESRDLFRSIVIAPVMGSETSSEIGRGHSAFKTMDADLDILIEEKKPRWLAVRAGYATTDRLNGGVEWGHRNVNGYGRKVVLGAEASARRIFGAATIVEPWPISWANTGRFQLKAEDFIREAFTERKFSGIVGLNIPLGISTVGKVSIDATRSEIRKVLENTRSEIYGDITDGAYNYLELTGDIERNTYDDRSFPREGSLSRLGVSVTALELESWKVTGQLGKVYELNDRNVLAFGASLGFTQGFGSTSKLPSARRFFLGGPDNLRGFRLDDVGPKDINKQAVGGDFYALGQAEWRFFPTDRGHGVIFGDVGQVFNRASDFDISALVYDFGIGIRAHTSLGPIRIEYAWPVVDSKIEPARLNFSVGYAF